MAIVRFSLARYATASLALLLAASAAVAAPPPDQACRGAKLKAAGKYAAGVLGCDAKAAKDGSTVDPVCLAKSSEKFTGSFASAETKSGVSCNGIDSAIAATVEETASDAGEAAPLLPGGGKCPSLTRKAAGKLASSILGAWSKFVTTADATKRDVAIDKARTTFASKMTKAEADSTGCAGTGQAEAVRTAIEDGLASVIACLGSAESCIETIEEVPAGGSATSDPGNVGPTEEAPVTAALETPNAGTVLLRVADAGSEAPSGYELLGIEIEIDAPPATAGDPLVLTFVIDSSLLPPDPNTIVLQRDGVTVADCSGAPGVASPDPCIQSRTVLPSTDFEIVVLSSHASLWTPLLPVVVACPTKMLWELRADAVGDDRATEVDVGWKGFTDSFDPASGSAMTFALDCASVNAPCGTCDVVGMDPAAGNCRCANDTRTICDEPGVADADDCGGSQCQCVVRVPSPVVAGGTSTCVVGVATNDPTGSWNVETGAGDVHIVERLKIFFGNSLVDPCPTCVGDTPGDGVADGTCNGGQSNGLSCEAHASDPTYPHPGGGFYSIDCMPSSGTNITGNGLLLSHTETTGTSTLTAALPCSAPNGSLMCACMVCSLNAEIGCSSDADCAAVSAGTCNSLGGGVSTLPDNCDVAGSCVADSDGEGTCPGGFPDVYCDGFVEEDGRGIILCNTNSDCDAHAQPGFEPGDCTVAVSPPCFDSTISATGLAHPSEPRTVATTCVPPTSNSGVNNAVGLPGPGRVRSDWFVTFVE
jgi:hypothetical protein